MKKSRNPPVRYSAQRKPIEQPAAPKKNIEKSEIFQLKSLSYSEYLGDPRQWVLEEFFLGDINLLVGKNASGKSRLLSVINGLTKLLTGELPKVFESGNYKICLASEKTSYIYQCSLNNSKVVREVLSKNGEILLDRGENGIGKIRAEQIDLTIDFETPPDQLAAKSRRDTIQHPFFEDLHIWARHLRYYQFGTALGRDKILQFTDNLLTQEAKDIESNITDQVTQLYVRAFNEFRDEFDKAILKDLALLGYRCHDVGADSMVLPGISTPVLVMFVKERDVGAQVNQMVMSQGMFRALSLVVQLNYLIFRKTPRTILIDDIGEGLDFSRSKAFISLLIERANANNLQLLMTTNDRFVMNGVPLENWGIVERKGTRVSVINRQNSEKVFAEFGELGLNNFDFFASSFFSEES